MDDNTYNMYFLECGSIASYDADAQVFEAKLNWCGEDIILYLEPDTEDADTAEISLKMFELMYSDRELWNRLAREYVAGYLKAHFSECLNIDGNELTDEDVKGFPELQIMCLGPDGSFEFSFYDNSLIGGKQLIAQGELPDGFKRVIVERPTEE